MFVRFLASMNLYVLFLSLRNKIVLLLWNNLKYTHIHLPVEDWAFLCFQISSIDLLSSLVVNTFYCLICWWWLRHEQLKLSFISWGQSSGPWITNHLCATTRMMMKHLERFYDIFFTVQIYMERWLVFQTLNVIRH